jgi:hypothetical protein
MCNSEYTLKRGKSLTTSLRTRTALWREVLLGADDACPYRPGRNLETRQRLGILPTWAFWNRRDVWRTARWYACPIAFVGVQGGFWIPIWLELSPLARLLTSQVIGLGILGLALGALERLIRRNVGRRQVAFFGGV